VNRIDIEKKALSIRHEQNIQSCGIKDIFELIEQMEIDLIRYPFGKDILCGFSAIFEGKKVMITNSSEILAREIFTAAHELAHLLYDFDLNSEDVKVDMDFTSNRESIPEKRADFFAACFLMPEELLRQFIIFKLDKPNFSLLTGLDIVRIQVEFNVSYSAVIERLKEIKAVNYEKAVFLYEEQTRYSSGKLFRMLNEDERLLKSVNLVKVPARFLEFVISNYNNNFVPYSSLDKALQLIDIDALPLKKEDSPEENQTIKLDELYEELNS
jgi:Zn-dependent peptidase ImmA (M78 family)